MATPIQVGFLRLKKGSLGTTTFTKSKDGVYRVHEKKVQNPNLFLNHPDLARTRENAQNFGTSASSAKLVRASVSPIIKLHFDSKLVRRLNSLIRKIIKLDPVSVRGKLIVTPENSRALLGFEMNSSCSLKSVFNTRFHTALNRLTGEVRITIPSFIPTDRIHAPKGTTHYQIIAVAAAIDFVNKKNENANQASALLEWNDNRTEDLTFLINLTDNYTQPVFIFLGLQFTQEMPGRSYAVSQYKMNPLSIVEVYNQF